MQLLPIPDKNNCVSTFVVSLTIITILTTCDHASGLETIKQIKKYGYPLETYQYWTDDKYLLGIERIPHSKYGRGSIGKPVLLVHGLYLSSVIFTISNSSLGFALSDAGFDVWLFNARAVGLSRKLSIYKKPGSQPRMSRISWDFSFHEMGIYDMTKAVDFVLNKTGYSKLDTLGYSMGTTIALVCLSERPEYNSKINKLLLMAPTSRLKSSGAPLNMFKQNSKLIENTIIDILSEFPQPMSTKTLKHMLQLLIAGRFCHYDYGYSGNLLRYHTRRPPDYDLSKITAPTYVLHSMNDTLVTPEDSRWLISQLPNVKDVYYIDKITWSHFSFSLSPNIKEVVNSYIINVLLD